MKDFGLIFHNSESTDRTRGALWGAYTGELVSGDCVQLQPQDEALRRFGLTITVGEAFDPVTDGDSSKFIFDCSNYAAHLHLERLRMVQLWSKDLKGWPPTERTVITYACALSPRSFVRFTVVVWLDFMPRFERHILGCRPGLQPQAQAPNTLGPTGRIEWWACLVEQAREA
jgi:hypothetical protein